MHSTHVTTPTDAPRRIRASDLAARYGIGKRLAADWLRAAVAAGIAAKVRSVIVGRWSALDGWVNDGHKAPIARTRKSPTKVRP